jgi:hypothetical protein
MLELSTRIRRAVARWLFAGDLRALYVAEEYGFGGRTADVIALWPEREQRRYVYRKVTEEWGGRSFTRTKNVGEKVKVLPAEVRIVEVKVSRADFLAGLRKGQIANTDNGFGAFADFCYVAAPDPLAAAIVLRQELPTGWGMLEYHDYENGGFYIDTIQKPTRLAPSHALTRDIDGLGKALAQSALWRLYGVRRKAPEELNAEAAL